MTKHELEMILLRLSQNRKAFHSEADFQFAFAWAIQETFPDSTIRLEYSPSQIQPSIHLDILVVIGDDWYPIELKYKTYACIKTVGDETFKLKSHGAQDLGRYDYLKDVQRIERLGRELPKCKIGYSILLTNDSAYWSNVIKDNSMGSAFKLYENNTKLGELRWAEHTGPGTMRGRESPIVLSSQYEIHWKDYSRLDDTKTGLFRYVILEFQSKSSNQDF